LLAESPKVIRYIKGFDEFVTSSVALIATGWSDPSPGGNLTHWISTPFTAHSFLAISGDKNPLNQQPVHEMRDEGPRVGYRLE